jgi:hypothetical protein
MAGVAPEVILEVGRAEAAEISRVVAEVALLEGGRPASFGAIGTWRRLG